MSSKALFFQRLINRFIYFDFRFLLIWKNGDTDFGKLWSNAEIIEINNALLQLNAHKPREIHRSVRSLSDLKFWKGTEFRSFLLYFGPNVLKRFLPADIYEHFLILVCAVTICYTSAYKNYLPVAKLWFNRYIERCIDIYGVHSLVSNIHNLTHV